MVDEQVRFRLSKTHPKANAASKERRFALIRRLNVRRTCIADGEIKLECSELLSPVEREDLRILLEMGLIEMRDDFPVLTNEGDRVINWS